MNKKILKLLLTCCFIVMLIFNITACGKNIDDDNQQGFMMDSEISFSDFLVERCVRKTLNKSWDDKITKSEVEGIKYLLIDNVYDPGLGQYYGTAVPKLAYYEGYIDLVDLKYLTGLEELRIDNLVDYDMIVNIDSISNCKKLKKLYMQCGQNLDNHVGGGYGYRYWADIIAELPELEYIDLGMYIDSHMKEVMLSKSNNKLITFYNGTDDLYAHQIMGHYSVINPMSVTDVENYSNMLKYEYNGNDIKLDNGRGTGLATIPVLAVSSSDELEQAINRLSETTEDLSIQLWKDCAEIDCNLFLKFKNLTTLTIVKEGMGLSYSGGRRPRVELKNISKLSELPYLQVINLAACQCNITELKNIKKLRELNLSWCGIENISSLSDIDILTELKIVSTDCDGVDEQFTSSIKELKGLKYYRLDCGDEDKHCKEEELIKYMPNLKTLYLKYHISNLSILENCKELEHLEIGGWNNAKEYDVKELLPLSKLKRIYIEWNIADFSDILKLPELEVVVMPHAIRNMDSKEINTCVEKVANSDKFSVFAIIDGENCDYSYDDVVKYSKENLEALYNKGIFDGFIQSRIIDGYDDKEKTFEEAYSGIISN